MALSAQQALYEQRPVGDVPMKRYRFAGGRVSVEEAVDLRPRRRHHPLRSSPIWIRLPGETLTALIPAGSAQQRSAAAGRDHDR